MVANIFKLCQYKSILGDPGTGFHSTRIMSFALWDIVGTIVMSWVLSKYSKMSFVKSTVVMFAVAVLLHWLFCVDTTFMKFLYSIQL